jgi:hypothetical protein
MVRPWPAAANASTGQAPNQQPHQLRPQDLSPIGASSGRSEWRHRCPMCIANANHNAHRVLAMLGRRQHLPLGAHPSANRIAASGWATRSRWRPLQDTALLDVLLSRRRLPSTSCKPRDACYAADAAELSTAFGTVAVAAEEPQPASPMLLTLWHPQCGRRGQAAPARAQLRTRRRRAQPHTHRHHLHDIFAAREYQPAQAQAQARARARARAGQTGPGAPARDAVQR